MLFLNLAFTNKNEFNLERKLVQNRARKRTGVNIGRGRISAQRPELQGQGVEVRESGRQCGPGDGVQGPPYKQEQGALAGTGASDRPQGSRSEAWMREGKNRSR